MYEFVLFLVVLQYLVYVAACLSINSSNKLYWTVCYIIAAIILRIAVPIEFNDDYFVYSQLFNYGIDFKEGPYLAMDEPLIRIIYLLFEMVSNNHLIVVKGIYILNFLVINVFFIRLLYIKKVPLIGKIIWFSLYYFLFSYVVLRNGFVYVSFALMIVSSYKRRFLAMYSFLCHLSGTIGLATLAVRKNFRFVMALTPVVGIVIYWLINEVKISVFALDKLVVYLDDSVQKSIGHYLLLVVVLSIYVIRRICASSASNRNIFNFLLILYIVGFIIKPVVGARLAPFLVTALLLSPINSAVKRMNTDALKSFYIVCLFLGLVINVLFFRDCHDLSF